MPNGMSIGPAVFAGYLQVTADRPTDHATRQQQYAASVCYHIQCGVKTALDRGLTDRIGLTHDLDLDL